MLTIRPLMLASVALAALPLSGLGQAQLVQVPWPLKQVTVRQLIAPPFDFIELCAEVKAGRAVDWQFQAEHPLGFNTHLHLPDAAPSAQKVYAPVATLSAAKGRLTASGEHPHCWMWSNPLPVPVPIRVQLGP